MRAYNIKVNGKIVSTVGGEKAGRFYSKSKRVSQKKQQATIPFLRLFVVILWWLLIATGCVGVCELKEKMKENTESVNLITQTFAKEGDFESADIPANYVEPDLFDKYFKDKAEEARKVAKCESGMNPNATNSTDDWGIMQINGKTWANYFGVTRDQLLDKETNIRLASEIYKLNGDWYDWRFSKKCHHLN